MESVTIPKSEYDQLLKYKNIVRHLEEDIHEELNVKQITDKVALEKLKRLDKDSQEGKRKTITDTEFMAKRGHLLGK